MSTENRPTEILEIKNFLSIKEARIEIKPITLLIGENATGKSVISKLVHLVREIFLRESLREAISDSFIIDTNTLSKDFLKLAWRDMFGYYFKDIFPYNYLKDNNFKLSYSINNMQVLSVTKSKHGIRVNFGRNFLNRVYDIIIKLIQQYIESRRYEPNEENLRIEPLIALRVSDTLHAKLFNTLGYVRNVFVPHARTMYLYIDLFDIEKRYERFDELMKSFLNMTEGLRGFIQRRLPSLDEEVLNHYLEYEGKVLKGKVKLERDDILVEINNKEFDIYHISSGQQELIPLILLLRYGLILSKHKSMLRLCVEEPETHLFPTTQRDLTYLFGYMYNLNTEFLITTHSPYILSAFNNLLFAKKLYKETAKKEIKEKYEKIWIDSKDISVYEVKDGYVRSIIDKEGLIEAEAIDEVSDEIAREIDKMLELADGEEDSSRGERK